MANVLLGVTGSVAAIYTPHLLYDLQHAGHTVKVVATQASLYFFDPTGAVFSTDQKRNPAVVVLDEDEWPGKTYKRGDSVLHIELRRWAEVLLIAPLDANTLGKMALGLTDNCLTCIYRAWDRTRPIILAPAMNTLMWEHPATARHLGQVAADLGSESEAGERDLGKLIAAINQQSIPLRIVPPVSKTLACDDVGVGALASREAILAMLGQVLTK